MKLQVSEIDCINFGEKKMKAKYYYLRDPNQGGWERERFEKDCELPNIVDVCDNSGPAEGAGDSFFSDGSRVPVGMGAILFTDDIDGLTVDL